MEPNECPIYDRCNAPVCPLDADWRKRVHSKNDSVCSVMLEHVKTGADARFAERPLMVKIRPRVITLIAAIELEKSEYGECRNGRGVLLRQIQSSAASGSSWDAQKRAGERLKASRQS